MVNILSFGGGVKGVGVGSGEWGVGSGEWGVGSGEGNGNPSFNLKSMD